MNKLNNVFAAVFALTFGLAANAAAQEACDGNLCFQSQFLAGAYEEAEMLYSTPGSTGTVDENSLGNYEMFGSKALLKKHKKGLAIVRYPFACQNLIGNTRMVAVSYKDEGQGGQLKLALKRRNVRNGEESTIWDFDSDARPTADASQTYVSAISGPNLFINCKDEVYYFEARIKKTQTGARPELDAIQYLGRLF